MEPLGLKIKKALARLGKSNNYLYTKPEQEWTHYDKALVISFLRKAKVAENMKDLNKVKEFFSKPLDEKKETGVGMAKKQLDALGVEYELGNKFEPFKVIYKPINKSDKFYDTFNNIINLYNLVNVVKSSMSEAKQEDPTDIIAMDVPLFLRMLEYAREDAKQDIDLHKVTERAIEAVKLRGLLSMDDYQDIIGVSKDELDEEVDFLSLKDDNPFDDIPSIDIQMVDDKEGASSPKAFVNFSSMYHSGDNGKMEILKNNPALQDKVMQMLQSEFQKTFRRVIHGVLGEPFGLDEKMVYSKSITTSENLKAKTQGLTQRIMDKILTEIITMGDNEREETIRLGEGIIEEELCAKGKAYRKRRIAAGEKSSAYLSGRAVKVCKGQMSGTKVKKKKVNEESDARKSATQSFQKMPIGKVVKTTKGDFKKTEADKFENISTKVKYNSAQMSYTTPSTK